MEYSLRWIEARKRFIELCEIHGNKTPIQNQYLNHLWNRWADLDDGDGSVVAKFVLEFSVKLNTPRKGAA